MFEWLAENNKIHAKYKIVKLKDMDCGFSAWIYLSKLLKTDYLPFVRFCAYRFGIARLDLMYGLLFC